RSCGVNPRSLAGRARKRLLSGANGALDRSRVPSNLQIDDEIICFDRDLERLGHIGSLEKLRARFDCQAKLPRPDGFWITPGLPRADVELPAVPGAADELPWTREAILPRRLGQRQADDHAAAQLGALMWTAVGQGEIVPAQLEEADLAAANAYN